jgi:uncharacterized repeat protein (TIGR04138 family)
VKSRDVDGPQVRGRAAMFPEEAFEFVREGLKYTVNLRHGPAATPAQAMSSRRHVSGQELCLGLKELAVQRWGLLTPTVFKKWGVTSTEDFGAIVYTMIDRRELKASEGDSIEDFRGVFDFDEAFGSLSLS